MGKARGSYFKALLTNGLSFFKTGKNGVSGLESARKNIGRQVRL